MDHTKLDTPFLSTTEAAKYLRLSHNTLNSDRITHSIGIPFRRHGGRIVYHRDDLEEFSKSRLVGSRDSGR